MPNEINVFEQEVETVIVTKSTQMSLPGLENFMKDQPSDKTTHMRMQVKRVVESLLFASSEPLTFQKIKEITDTIFEFQPRALRSIIQALQDDYVMQNRAFRLEEIAQGFVLRTCEEFSPYIELMGRNKRTEKLSHAAAEVLAIIAYRQPITRPQIDAIRGVDSSGTIYSLLERQLIQAAGKLEAPGRPTLYEITKDFLKHFGLRDLAELPQLETPV